MGYFRIRILLSDGSEKTGVRHMADLENIEAIRAHAFKLSVEVLGRGAIKDVTVEPLSAEDPAVVTLILKSLGRTSKREHSLGEHPFTKEQRKRPLH
jgi:hypothetical protein